MVLLRAPRLVLQLVLPLVPQLVVRLAVRLVPRLVPLLVPRVPLHGLTQLRGEWLQSPWPCQVLVPSLTS